MMEKRKNWSKSVHYFFNHAWIFHRKICIPYVFLFHLRLSGLFQSWTQFWEFWFHIQDTHHQLLLPYVPLRKFSPQPIIIYLLLSQLNYLSLFALDEVFFIFTEQLELLQESLHFGFELGSRYKIPSSHSEHCVTPVFLNDSGQLEFEFKKFWISTVWS